jgi:hypothetical protein
MPKYKISKGYLKEFFGFIGRKKTPKEIQNLVDTDPVLQKLQNDLKGINSKNQEYFDKLKIKNPKLYNWLQDNGMINKDY